MGEERRSNGGRRDPSYFCRPRRNTDGLRQRANRRNVQSCIRAGDRFGRRETPGAFCRDLQRRGRRCSPGRLDLSRWSPTDSHTERVPCCQRYRGSPPVLIPCIDLQGGQAVQLVHGRKRELAVADVFGLLKSFSKYPWLHVIDLDAAMGKGSNGELVRTLCAQARTKFKMKVRVGGGIRTISCAKKVAAWGANQIVIGSAVFRNGELNLRFLRKLNREVNRKRIVIALDTLQGRITIHAWRKRVALQPEKVMAQLEPFCAGFLCTDVDREGTMTGANLKWFQKLRCATDHPIIAAGGIRTKREIAALEKLGMDAAVGMALYKNCLR